MGLVTVFHRHPCLRGASDDFTAQAARPAVHQIPPTTFSSFSNPRYNAIDHFAEINRVWSYLQVGYIGIAQYCSSKIHSPLLGTKPSSFHCSYRCSAGKRLETPLRRSPAVASFTTCPSCILLLLARSAATPISDISCVTHGPSQTTLQTNKTAGTFLSDERDQSRNSEGDSTQLGVVTILNPSGVYAHQGQLSVTL